MKKSNIIALVGVGAVCFVSGIYVCVPTIYHQISLTNSKNTLVYSKCQRTKEKLEIYCQSNPALCEAGRELFSGNWLEEQRWQNEVDKAEGLGDTQRVKWLNDHRPQKTKEPKQASCAESAELDCNVEYNSISNVSILNYSIKYVSADDAKKCDEAFIEHNRQECKTECLQDKLFDFDNCGWEQSSCLLNCFNSNDRSGCRTGCRDVGDICEKRREEKRTNERNSCLVACEPRQ
jgi:hypothetical protein